MLKKIQTFDEYLFQKIYNKTFPRILDKIMIFFSYIGNCGYIWLVVTAVFYYGLKHKYVGINLILVLAFATILGQYTIKPIIKRPRPCHSHQLHLKINTPKDYSFPSGHTMSSFACVMIIINYNPFFGILSLVIASLIAFSRMYLCVHYFSDVFSGAMLGLIVGQLILKLF